MSTRIEYGLFARHGSSEILLQTFRKAETVGLWRTIHPDVEVVSVRTREVTEGEWSDPIGATS